MTPAPLGSTLADAVADELIALTETLGALAVELGTDTEIVRRHIGALQAVDHIVQIQLALADVLRMRGPDSDRIAGVPLEALAGRLRAAVKGAPDVRHPATADEHFGHYGEDRSVLQPDPDARPAARQATGDRR